MSRKVNITCRYYNVKAYKDNPTSTEKYNLLNWLNSISEMSLTSRTKSIGQTRGRLDNIARRNNFYALNFIRMESYSSTYIVTDNENAKHVDISVENDEYIGKNTVAIYDSENAILMLMGNQGGFSAHTITSYINSFFEQPVCVLDPIKTNKNFDNPDNKYGKISIKISNVHDYVSTHGCAYEEALDKARDMGANTMSFEFSMGRKTRDYLDANMVKTIISDAYSNMGAVSIARVKMQDEEGTAIYNLFENVKNVVISLQADFKGEIEYTAIASAMIDAYK